MKILPATIISVTLASGAGAGPLSTIYFDDDPFCDPDTGTTYASAASAFTGGSVNGAYDSPLRSDNPLSRDLGNDRFELYNSWQDAAESYQLRIWNDSNPEPAEVETNSELIREWFNQNADVIELNSGQVLIRIF